MNILQHTKNRPLLSILIATRNRQETASIVISEILKLDLANVELIVSDTSDEQNLLGLIKLRADTAALIYKHSTTALSMSDNYSNAIDMSTGEYICMIGDDDFILPHIIQVVEFAKANNLASVTQNIGCNFVWDTYNSGTLNCRVLNKQGIVVKTTDNALSKILLKGGMMTADAPRLYHGIVRRDVFAHLKQRFGQYFFGTSPDISASVSICCLTDIYGFSYSQFTVPGASNKSNSNIGLKKLAPHMSGFDHVALHADEIWPTIIPPLHCAETGWPEATYKTLMVLKPAKLADLNLLYCYFLMYLKYNYQSKYITPAFANYFRQLSLSRMMISLIKLIYMVISILSDKFKRIFFCTSYSISVLPSILNISSNLQRKNNKSS